MEETVKGVEVLLLCVIGVKNWFCDCHHEFVLDDDDARETNVSLSQALSQLPVRE